MNPKSFSDRLHSEFARIGKAVSSPRRLQLLELLSQGERTVETLADRAGLSVANTSQHLQTLRRAGLVVSERDGLFVSYRLAGPDVRSFLGALRALARSRLAEVDRVRQEYMESRDSMEHVDSDTLIARVRRGDVMILDVRPEEEYGAGHVSGAVSVPLSDLGGRLDSLPRDRDIVAYCRGPYCVLSVDAVALLRQHGFEAFHLEDGIYELQAKGLEVVSVGDRSNGAVDS